MSIKLNAQSGGSVALDAPTQTTSSADLTFKLPVADGSANHVLKTDGSANLSFAEAVGKIRKYTTFTHDGYVTGNYEGDPNGIDHGYQLINASYTPAAADSTIVLLSSSLTIAEGSNQLNNFIRQLL
jgi:hypothetical protein